MSITPLRFPANWKLPLVGIDVDGSKAGNPTNRQLAILFGQKFASGGAAASVPVACSNALDSQTFFGQGSMLDRMMKQFLKENPGAFIWCMPLAEPSAGVAATGSITVTAAATAPGIYWLYIAGQIVQVAVFGTETATSTATLIAAAINAIPDLPVTAAATTGTVALTCKWKGLTGNDIVLMDNYAGTLGGQSMPTGLAVTYTPMANGAGAPDLTNAIAAMGDDLYKYCAFPFTDTISLGAMETEYGMGDTGRWGWMREIYGSIFSAARGSYNTLLTLGAAGNSPVSSIMGFELLSPSPVWEWAASYCGQAAIALLNDPAQPLQTLEMQVLPAPKGQRFSKTQRNNLASSGIAVQEVAPSGNPMILVEASRYQKNSYGQGDDAYFVITTLHTLDAVLTRMKFAITSKFPRCKLADDGTPFGPGQAIITPKSAKAELIVEYGAMEYDGLVENLDAFKANLIVERDNNNPNRLNTLYPPDLVNQLRIFYVLAQFRLQYSQLDQAA